MTCMVQENTLLWMLFLIKYIVLSLKSMIFMKHNDEGMLDL